LKRQLFTKPVPKFPKRVPAAEPKIWPPSMLKNFVPTSPFVESTFSSDFLGGALSPKSTSVLERKKEICSFIFLDIQDRVVKTYDKMQE